MLKKKVWVTELQAEPWEPGELVHKEVTEPVSTWPNMMSVSLHEMRSLGIDTLLLWGAEYWIYRKNRYKDKGWWVTATNLLTPKKTGPVHGAD